MSVVTDDYQLMENATVVGYERETTPGIDAAGANGGRQSWIGAVLGIPSLSEDYGHQDHQPLGSGPDPQIVLSKKHEFETEFEGFVSRSFLDALAEELLSFSLGSVNPSTGEVTFFRPIPNGTYEWGWKHPGQQSVDVTILLAVDSVEYKITINGVDFTYVATVPADTDIDIATALVTAINAGSENVTADNASGTSATVTIVATTAPGNGTPNPGSPFNSAIITDSDPLTEIKFGTKLNMSWFHKLVGGKAGEVSLTFRPDAQIMCRIKITARNHIAGENFTLVSSGSNIAELTVTDDPGVHHDDVSYTLLNHLGDAIPGIVREFDLTWTQNLSRIMSDNQAKFASHLVEGKRRFTFNIKTSKVGNHLLDISRAEPHSDEGKLDVRVLVDQAPDGWYFDLHLATCVLAERTNDLGEDIDHNEESFAGMMVGLPTLDMRRP